MGKRRNGGRGRELEDTEIDSQNPRERRKLQSTLDTYALLQTEPNVQRGLLTQGRPSRKPCKTQDKVNQGWLPVCYQPSVTTVPRTPAQFTPRKPALQMFFERKVDVIINLPSTGGLLMF